MPRPRRLFPAPVPALVASVAGSADWPICFSESSGAPGRRRTFPPSWSVIKSSGALTGFWGLAAACLSVWMTARICATTGYVVGEENDPGRLAVTDQREQAGRWREALVAVDHPLARHLSRRQRGKRGRRRCGGSARRRRRKWWWTSTSSVSYWASTW